MTAQSTIVFSNGRWFNGTAFEARDFYSVNGVLQSQRPAAVDSTIDLKGGYVIPPFGEAHNHNVEGSARTDAVLSRYIAEGIFYVLNPNSLPQSRTQVGDRVNQPGKIDVIFANGGLNVTGGHPWDLVQRNIARGSWQPQDAEGAFYHTIDDRAALEQKWPRILAGKPDFIKIYLLFSNEYEKRRNDTTANGFKGLNPRIVPEIVRRAHAANLRVAAHIENAHDFRAAVAAGADIIAHMPGYGWLGTNDSSQYLLSADDARAAARQGTTVITTLGFGRRGNATVAPNRSPAQVRKDAFNAANLRTLKNAGVRLAIGSDNYGNTARSEALYLSDLGVFSNLELLKLWTENTAALILPGRKVGQLRDGYEASFIVLETDPLTDFGSVLRISKRVKQGRLLN
ncbi:MAG: amidohydrolase family protein [Gemmatimonadota bacterium]